MPEPDPFTPLDQDLPDWRPVSDVDPSEWSGDRGVDTDTDDDGGEQPVFKPHSFALAHGDGGAKIAYGEFIWWLNRLTFTLGSSSLNLVDQPAVSSPTQIVPTIQGGNPMTDDVPNNYHQLDAYGDVWIYWELTATGYDVNVCDIRVGAKPSTVDIPSLTTTGTPAIVRNSWTEGKFTLQIGTVNEGVAIEQNISSDIYWYPLLVNPQA